jgi:hypothetical protein
MGFIFYCRPGNNALFACRLIIGFYSQILAG